MTNQGHGIKVLQGFSSIQSHIEQELHSNQRYSNFILQRYILNPYLINKRKFDIRVFALFTAHTESKLLRGFVYEEGYLRTCCKEYDVSQIDNRFIHLTNDAVQKYSADYGKFESGNKISYSDFDKTLLKDRNVSFTDKILPKIRQATRDVFEACGARLYRPPKSQEFRAYNAFEVLGFDYMLDEDLNLTLIEVNTNPSLDTPCLLL